jgi:polysaccharide chain length determinant protein (PEP-CTERM system associated)
MLPGKIYKPADYLGMAWRRRWYIVVPMLVAIYAALIVSSHLHDMYKSETLIQVVPQRVPDSYVRSTVTMRTEDRLSALSQQVLSRTALEGLILKLGLYSDELRTKPMQDVVEAMREHISVEVITSRPQNRDAEADAFYVRFTYPDREIATRVTENLGGLFIDLNARDRGDLAEATDKFLQSQLAETRRALETQERRLESFRERNAGRLPTQLSFNMQAIQTSQLAVQANVESLARDRDRKLMLERLYNDATETTTAPVVTTAPAPQPATGSDPAVPSGTTTQQQLALARETLNRLELRLKPEHPDIVRTKRLIQELEQRAALETAEPRPASPATVATPEQLARVERLRQMRAEIESLDRQIHFKEMEDQRQRAQLGEYQHRIEQVPGVESEWIALSRDYDTQQAAYKDLLMKAEQSKVAVELERHQIGEQFKILDPARPPVRPTGIRRLQVNALSAVAGLLLGLGLAALMEFTNRTFETGDDVLQVIKLPVLASVPYVPTATDVARVRRYRIAAYATTTAVSVAGGYGMWALQLWKFIK